ncbi:MAG: CDP-alcohol phosphatidyltransferase family protein [Flavisolibacter sp.]
MPTTTAERFWTIPNVLSLYRIIIFPFILWLILSARQDMFAIFFSISLVTDFLDGFIARTFRMQTQIGVKLDSWADLGTYILAFIAIGLFKWQEIKPHALILYVFAGIMALSYLIVFIKFKGLIGLHTYMFKITGYLQGAFLISLFVWGFYLLPYYVCLAWGTLACVEEIIIILMLKEARVNVKGLYWLLQNKNS